MQRMFESRISGAYHIMNDLKYGLITSVLGVIMRTDHSAQMIDLPKASNCPSIGIFTSSMDCSRKENMN